MSTGRDLVKGALRLVSESSRGLSPASEDFNQGFSAFNEMLDSWSSEGLLVPSRTSENFTLSTATHIYTIGPGGDFNTARPLTIEPSSVTLNNNDYPLKRMTQEEYVRIITKANSGRPTRIYYEPGFPIGTIYLDFKPDEAYSLNLHSYKPLVNLATLTTELIFPPGYYRALRYNLALELAAEYDKEPKQIVVRIAQESKDAIERINARFTQQKANIDSAILNYNNAYNINVQ